MKKIEAVIKPFKLEDVKEALAVLGVNGITASEVKGFGQQRGEVPNFPKSEDGIDFLPKTKIEVIVPDDKEGVTIGAIVKSAKYGQRSQIGDGIVWVTDVSLCIRVRTGEDASNFVV